MASENSLIIGYGGTLPYYPPKAGKNGFLKRLKDYTWSYFADHHNDPVTKSPYYFFHALQRFREQYPDLASVLEVKLWGNLQEGNRRLIETLEIGDMVHHEGFVTKDQLIEALKACDVLLFTMASGKNGNKPFALTGKLFDYLQLGKPIFALIQESDCADILRRSGLGIICDPYDVEKIADRLAQLLREKDQWQYTPDTAFIHEHFNFENLSGQLAALFDDVLDRQPQAATHKNHSL